MRAPARRDAPWSSTAQPSLASSDWSPAARIMSGPLSVPSLGWPHVMGAPMTAHSFGSTRKRGCGTSAWWTWKTRQRRDVRRRARAHAHSHLGSIAAAQRERLLPRERERARRGRATLRVTRDPCGPTPDSLKNRTCCTAARAWGRTLHPARTRCGHAPSTLRSRSREFAASLRLNTRRRGAVRPTQAQTPGARAPAFALQARTPARPPPFPRRAYRSPGARRGAKRRSIGGNEEDARTGLANCPSDGGGKPGARRMRRGP